MPRQLQSKIHSDFSSETYKWEIYQAQLQELFDASTETEDFNDHLVREYNRKISRLNQSSFLYIDPYDGGYRLTNNVVNGLKLSLDLSFDANTTWSQSTVGSTTFTLASRYGPNASFSRLSPATFRGSNGLIQYAPENLLKYSERFDAYWTPSATSVTVNATTAPDGTQTAEKLIESLGVVNETHLIYQVTSTFATSTTFSVYLKKAERSYAGVAFSMPSDSGVYVNLDTGTVISNLGTAPSSYSVINVGNGWWRISVTSSIITGNPYIILSDGTVTTTRAFYTGNGTSGIYVWGAQLERHSTARPYISTTSTAVYGPRLEYDVNGNALGLLIEESSSNLLAYSEQFNDGAWGKVGLAAFGSGSVADTTATLDPYGRNTADLIRSTSGGGQHNIQQGSGTSGSTTCTFSVFLKYNNNKWIGLAIYDIAWRVAAFDMENGVVGTAISSGVTASISNAGNGWYRCTVTYPSASSTVYGGIFFLPSDTTSIIWTATGVESVYIWGAQLEQKAYPTSYIPTATSGGIARAADTCTLNIDFPLTWFNESEGTIMVEGDRLHSPALNAGSYDSLFIFSAGGGASLGHFGDGTSELFAASDGSNIVTALSVSLPNQPLLFVGSYSASFGEIYVSTNNTVTQSQAGFSGFSTPDTITFGYSAGVGEYLNGHIKSFKYYKKSLDSTIMEALPL